MACGRPVVASDVYGIPELVVDGETGWLVPPLEVGALRGRLEALIDDSTLREAMGRAGRRRFEDHFTLERQRAAMERIYDALSEGVGK
jgi:glycosyltransferase involved in cell wall biosynthesis